MSDHKPMTAKEQQDLLERDPKYQALMAEKRKRWAEAAARARENEKPVVEALTAAGWPLNVRQCGEARSVWDLVNTAEPYPHLIDVLAEHLVGPYDKYTRESIARALAVKEARGTRVPRMLLEELKKESDPKDGPNSYRWVLINTLVTIGDASLLDEVTRLLGDPRYESVRKDLQRLVKAMSRTDRKTSR